MISIMKNLQFLKLINPFRKIKGQSRIVYKYQNLLSIIEIALSKNSLNKIKNLERIIIKSKNFKQEWVANL
jgi:hypothetical protein